MRGLSAHLNRAYPLKSATNLKRSDLACIEELNNFEIISLCFETTVQAAEGIVCRRNGNSKRASETQLILAELLCAPFRMLSALSLETGALPRKNGK